MYTYLALKDLTELKNRRGTSANTTAASIMGPTFPTTEAYTVYVWDDANVNTPDDNEIVQPIVGASNGRWLKVDLDTSAINLSIFYTKLDLSTAGNATVAYQNIIGLSTVATTGSYTDLISKPTLSTVATTGSYTDLINTPTIPAAQIQSDWNQLNVSLPDYIKNKPSLSTVATTGSYTDLTNKPTIPSAQIQSDWNQTNTSSLDYIKNKPVRSQSVSTRTLDTPFTVSSTRDSLVIYSINITVSFTLLGAQTGTVFLDISSNGTTWTTVSQSTLTWSGGLTVGLSLTISQSQTVSCYVPSNYQTRLRTSGTGTFSYVSGQEILL